jgi:hypothetical protein
MLAARQVARNIDETSLHNIIPLLWINQLFDLQSISLGPNAGTGVDDTTIGPMVLSIPYHSCLPMFETHNIEPPFNIVRSPTRIVQAPGAKFWRRQPSRSKSTYQQRRCYAWCSHSMGTEGT